MTKSLSPIFRNEAVWHHAQGRTATPIPPCLGVPRVRLAGMLLAALLVAGAGLAWRVEIPVYIPVLAVGVNARVAGYDPYDAVATALFLPPEHQGRLRVGQPVFLRFNTHAERLSLSIVAAEPGVLSPAAAMQRFALGAGATAVITPPAAVALTRFGPMPLGVPASSFLGSVGRVEVEVGLRPFITLFPLVNRMVGGNR